MELPLTLFTSKNDFPLRNFAFITFIQSVSSPLAIFHESFARIAKLNSLNNLNPKPLAPFGLQISLQDFRAKFFFAFVICFPPKPPYYCIKSIANTFRELKSRHRIRWYSLENRLDEYHLPCL